MAGQAVIIGSGPNGLAAGIALARAGIKVRVYEAEAQLGGGLRTSELTLPGYLHDLCSAVHPLAVASPFFKSLPLAEHGLRWIQPEIDVAHPLDDGTAAWLVRSLDESVKGLGRDGQMYRTIVGPLANRFDELLDDIFRPMVHLPRHPGLLAKFGMRGAYSAETLASAFETQRARALLAGLAGHAIAPFEAPFTASFALLFAASAHAGGGWPIPAGGSQSLANALAGVLRAHGGEILCGSRIDRLDQAGAADAYLFDTSPSALARIAGDRLPQRYLDAAHRFRHGPGVFKIDYALNAPVPWRAEECRRAGTVHVGGTFAEIATAEREAANGVPPERPFVLVAQQSLFDPSRAPAGHHTLWAYCHVPNGSSVDMTERIEAQLERFAPGFKDTVVARKISTPQDLERRNANLVGGDIGGGATDGLQLFARPRLALDPYSTPTRDLFICSASTPPGAGVHGMCGANAAASALRRRFKL